MVRLGLFQQGFVLSSAHSNHFYTPSSCGLSSLSPFTCLCLELSCNPHTTEATQERCSLSMVRSDPPASAIDEEYVSSPVKKVPDVQWYKEPLFPQYVAKSSKSFLVFVAS